MRSIFIIVIIVLVVVGSFYLWNQYRARGTAPVITEEQKTLEGRLLELRQIKDLKLDTSVFRDPFFRSLQFQSQPSLPPPTGRSNPFLSR